MPSHRRRTVAVLALLVLPMATHCFSSLNRAVVSVVSQRGAMPRMDAIGDVAQLEAQLKILQLKAQIAEMQAQEAAPAVSPAPAAAGVLVSPPPLPVPAPAEVPPPLPVPAPTVSEPTLPIPAPIVSQPPLPEAEVCLGLNAQPKECTELVDLNDLFGGLKPAFSLDGLPSPDQLLQPETAIPLIGGFVVLSIGYIGVRKASDSLRPDDAATARRKREERERLGISEWDEEQSNNLARDGLVAALLIVVFEVAIFNARGLWS